MLLMKGVASQWAKSPQYMAVENNLQEKLISFTVPMLSLSFSDDAYSSLFQIKKFHEMTNSEIHYLHYSPSDIDVEKIGHVGFFQKKFRHSLWPVALDYIAEGKVDDEKLTKNRQRQTHSFPTFPNAKL